MTADANQVAESTVSSQLLALLTSHLRRIPADVNWETVQLSDLGLDSMSAIELVVAIEDTFGGQFPEDSLVRETFATFPALRSVVQTMVSQ